VIQKRKTEMKDRLYIKHSMSCLRDLGMEVDIDQDLREVRLTMPTFDSALVSTAVTSILPEKHGVVAFRDDGAKDEAWLTRPAPYSLYVRLADVTYRSQVVKLFDSRIAITLEPIS
jgi:hypothetical protein